MCLSSLFCFPSRSYDDDDDADNDIDVIVVVVIVVVIVGYIRDLRSCWFFPQPGSTVDTQVCW